MAATATKPVQPGFAAESTPTPEVSFQTSDGGRGSRLLSASRATASAATAAGAATPGTGQPQAGHPTGQGSVSAASGIAAPLAQAPSDDHDDCCVSGTVLAPTSLSGGWAALAIGSVAAADKTAPLAAGTPGRLVDPVFAPLATSDTFLLHSRPTASKRIFLDFDGHTMTNSAWELGGALALSAYAPYTGDLHAEVQQIWKTLAEYFAPFDVDVTTQEPGSARLSNSGGSDSEWGIRVVFADSQTNLLTGQRLTQATPNSGGQAFLNSFSGTSDEPALVFIRTGSYDAATCAAHEIGHTLGLRHQGTFSSAYYSGHGGNGATSWCPIMGTSYLDNVRESLITWSKGDYANANNTEDALSIITTYNGFGYRPDSVGASFSTARILSGSSFQQFGIIERNTDIDLYSFVTAPGNVCLSITNAVQAWIASGGSSGDPYLSQAYSDRLVSPGLSTLDIGANLYDANGNLIASSNPVDSLGASFDLNLPGGRYFLSIDGVGYGNPFSSTPTGYSDYGILGQYVISGQVQESNGLMINAPNPLVTDETGGSTTFQIALISEPSNTVRISVSSDNPAEGRPSVSSLVFTQANWNVGQNVKVTGQDDFLSDGRVGYNIILDTAASTAPEYSALAPRKLVAFNDDNEIPTLTLTGPASETVEGQASSVDFKLNLNLPSRQDISLNFTTVDGTATAGSDYAAINRTVVIPAGQTQLTVPVSLINNAISEPNESFSVQVGSLINANLVGPAQVSAWISDAITSASSTTLPNGVEVLRLSGNAASNGSGNSGPNQLIGNDASNQLKGGGGLDILTGLGGQDTFDLTAISSSADAETITDFVTGLGGERLLISNDLTSRSGTGTPAVRTISSLNASSLILETSSKSSSPGYDLFLVNTPMTKASVDLATSNNGSELLDGLFNGSGPVMLSSTTAAGKGYIGAYDNANFYLYYFSAGSRDTTISSGEIQLIGVLDAASAIAPGALVESNFQLV